MDNDMDQDSLQSEIVDLKNELYCLRRICNTINHHTVADYNKWFFATEAKGKRLGFCQAKEMLKDYFREKPYDGSGKLTVNKSI